MTLLFKSIASSLCLMFYFAKPVALKLLSPSIDSRRTSSFGRRFLLMAPLNYKVLSTLLSGDHDGEVCFLTFENIARVVMMTPLKHDLYKFGQEIIYNEMIVETNMASAICMKFKLHLRATTSKIDKGHAIRIRAESDIAVMVTYIFGGGQTQTFMLPPTSAYSTRYFINLPIEQHLPGYLILLASHDNTLSTIILKNEKINVALNAFSFANIRWEASEYKKYSGGHLISTKRVLVLSGVFVRNALLVAPSYSILSKTFVVFDIDLHRASEYRRIATVLVQPWNRNKPYRLTINEKAVYRGRGETYMKQLDVSQPTIMYISSNNLVSVIMHSYWVNILSQVYAIVIVPEIAWTSIVYYQKPVGYLENQKFEMNIIMKKDKLDGLLYNGREAKKTTTLKWNQPKGSPYSFGKSEIAEHFTTIMHTDPRKNFAAYVTSYSSQYSSYTSAISLNQFYRIPTKTTNCLKKTDMRPGDDIDNDCDNKFDEEVWDGKDNDGDSRVDEDLMLERAKGFWESWQPWHCEKKCPRSGSTGKVEWKRYRSCDNPRQENGGGACVGSNFGKKDGPSTVSCNTNCDLKNKLECPLGIFSSNCNIKCPEGCWMDVCHQDSGQCMACKTQYKYMPYCEHENYKHNWTISKASYGIHDIHDSVSTNYIHPLALIILIQLAILLCLLVYMLLKKKLNSDDDEIENEEEEEENIEEHAGTEIKADAFAQRFTESSASDSSLFSWA